MKREQNSTSKDLGSNSSIATGSGHGQFSEPQNDGKINYAYFTWLLWIPNENIWETIKALDKCKSLLSSAIHKDLENIL